ncbi:MAG: hypothetical protein RLZZ110_1794, partial [Bacteroidota bacterium]
YLENRDSDGGHCGGFATEIIVGKSPFIAYLMGCWV